MADKTPAFQFYPKDFLASDVVSLMNTEQIGAYVLLLCHAWNNPEGLPESTASLAKLARTGAQRFQRSVWPMIQGQFYQCHEGRWFNDRLEQERAKQADFRVSASKAGKRSAEQRALNARSTDVDIPLQGPFNGTSTLLSSSSSSVQDPPVVPQGGRTRRVSKRSLPSRGVDGPCPRCREGDTGPCAVFSECQQRLIAQAKSAKVPA